MRASRHIVVVLALSLGALGAGAAEAAQAQPRGWEGLRLWPGQPLRTVGAGSTSPALAIGEEQLFLGEINQGAVYISELVPDTGGASWTKLVAAGASGRDRRDLHAAVVGKTVWLAWLEAPAGTPETAPRALMLAGFRLEPQTATEAVAVANTRQGAIAEHNAQLWLAWLGPPESNSLSLSAGPEQNGFVVNWRPPSPGSLSGLGLADFGADLLIPYVTEAAGQASLWQASYNGHRFHGVRKLRGTGHLGPLAAARLQTRALILYTLFVGEAPGVGNLVLTVSDAVGAGLSSTEYLADGNTNLRPSLAVAERTVWLAYNAWSAPPETSGAKNLGLFLGKIELGL